MKDPKTRASLTNRVSTVSQVSVMKGLASPLSIAQRLRLPDHHMFLHVIGPYGFVQVPSITC